MKMKMSQTIVKLNKLAGKLNNQPSEGISSKKPGIKVRDSLFAIKGENLPTGTFSGLMIFTLLSSLIFSLGVGVFNNTVSATSSSITLTIVSGTENPTINIPPTTEGKFVASSNTTAKVVSTHAAGYVLTTTATPLAFTDSGTSTTYTINPLSSGTAINAATFANESNTQYNNKWGYKPSQYYNGTSVVDNTTSSTQFFFPAPINTTQTIDNTNTVTPAAGTTYDVAVGARIDNTAQMGTYTSSFTFAVVGNLTPYSITYNANAGSDTVTNMPTPNPQTGNADQSTSTVTLSNAVPERDGYIFKGWCTTQIADDATCSSTTYNPDGGGTDLSFPLDLTSSSNTYTIYAMWESASSDLFSVVEAAWKAEGSRVMTNDADTSTGIQADITTSNSGVFKYNPSTFGTASDASNTKDIYFYRGILDTTTSSYGSNGDNAAHPNTVLLDANSNGTDITDTCWRIVRTTGSGGVKMIYQGKWTGSTCANAQAAAQVTTSAYNGTSATYQRIALVGYTYNPTYGDSNVTTATSVDTVFGSNSNYSANSSNSTIKGYIENTWFSNISTYESILEPSAGYCNDRTAYSDNTTSTALSTIVPYATSGATMYFGAYGRNINATDAGKAPSLTCPSNRNVVDLYTTSSSSNGNKQLTKPAALLTADEVSLAGSGRSTASQGSAYHANSFLRSGSSFWLLSPGSRSFNGTATGFYLGSNGILYSGDSVRTTFGVRPAISLTSGTTASSGSGTATDPWVVTPPPPTMQDFAAGTAGTTCSSMSVGDTITLSDSRDGEEYLVGKLADNKCWMLENLNLAGGTALSSADTDVTDAYINSFTTSNNLTKSGNTIVLPASSTSGFSSNNYSYVYNSGNKTNCGASGQNTPCYSYYSWDAATLGSGRSISTDNTDAQQSICPKNWRLPTSRTTSATNWQTTSDFYAMAHQYGLDSTISTAESDADFCNNAGPGTTPNFLLAGRYFNGSFGNGGSYGYYWSSTSYSSTSNARNLNFNSTNVYSADNLNRRVGTSVRCLFSE